MKVGDLVKYYEDNIMYLGLPNLAIVVKVEKRFYKKKYFNDKRNGSHCSKMDKWTYQL